MSTQCYHTDLNAAGLDPRSPRTCWQPGRVGGNARPTRAPSFTRSLLAANRLQVPPATPRIPAPSTITFVPGKMRASWPKCKGRFMSRRACLPCPSVVILDCESVKTGARRHPWFRSAQTGQRAQTHRAHRVCFVPAVGRQSR
jgi:hypothetical protein